MNHENPAPAPQEDLQFYKLTVDQAEQLDRLGPGEEARQLAQSFGALAIEGGFAVVVGSDESGAEQPLHLMHLGKDLGTTVNLEQPGKDKKYPSLEDAYKLVSEPAQEQDTPVEQMEEPSIVIERAIEQSHLREVLQGYGRLQSALDEGSRINRTALRNAADDIQQKMRSFFVAADAMPGGEGQRLGEVPSLLRSAQELTEDLQRTANRMQTSSQIATDEGRRFDTAFTEASETADRQLRDVPAPEAHMVMRATDEVRATLEGFVPFIQRQGEDKTQQVSRLARLVDSISYERSMTIEEAIGILRRAQGTLEELDADTIRATGKHHDLLGQVTRLQNLLRK